MIISPEPKPETKSRGYTTEEQADAYLKLWDRKFIRIDPTTKKAHDNSKDYFYEIVGMYPWLPGTNETEYRTQLEVQKYWRSKTYKVKADPKSKNPTDVIKHEAFCERNASGDMTVPGSFQIDAEDFVKQFSEDSSI